MDAFTAPGQAFGRGAAGGRPRSRDGLRPAGRRRGEPGGGRRPRKPAARRAGAAAWLLVLWLAGTLASSLPASPAGAAAPPASPVALAQVQAQERRVTAQLASAQAAYAQALAAWQEAAAHLRDVDLALHAAAARLAALTDQLAAAQAALVRLAAAVAAERAVVARDDAKASYGLTVIYEHGSVSFVGVLLGANSFADFLTRLSLLKRIWDMEVGYLRAAEVAAARLQLLEARQRSEVLRLADLRGEAAAELAVVQREQAAAAVANAREDQAVAAADAVVAQLAAARSGLEARIRQLLAEIASRRTTWSQVLRDINLLASQYGIDPLLVEAVVLQESGGNAHVTSTAGAMGLMQLMPGTAAELGVHNAFDPIQNLRGGITYLLQMLHEFHGNLTLALAAYNAGPYAVKEYGGVPPYAETQVYVRNVLAMYESGK